MKNNYTTFWTEHPTGNESVQNRIVNIAETIVLNYYFDKKLYENMAEEDFVCPSCMPEELVEEADEYARGILDCLQDEDIECIDHLKMLVKEDVSCKELIIDVISMIYEKETENLEKQCDDNTVQSTDALGLAEVCIAITFLLLELRCEFDKDVYEMLVGFLELAYDMEVIYIEEVEKYLEMEYSEYQATSEILKGFIYNWETIVDTYLEDDSTYNVVLGLDIPTTEEAYENKSKAEELKRTHPLYNLFGIGV